LSASSKGQLLQPPGGSRIVNEIQEYEIENVLAPEKFVLGHDAVPPLP
jgi:hypothetical protein